VTIKLGAGGKPLMVGGKVVTNCDCCAGPPPGGCAPVLCGCIDESHNLTSQCLRARDCDFAAWPAYSEGCWLCPDWIWTFEDTGLGYWAPTNGETNIRFEFSTSVADCSSFEGNQTSGGALRLYPNGSDWRLIVFHVVGIIAVSFYRDLTAAELNDADINGTPISNGITACNQQPWTTLTPALEIEFGVSSCGFAQCSYTVAHLGSLKLSLP
jgi:hypothetical protein